YYEDALADLSTQFERATDNISEEKMKKAEENSIEYVDGVAHAIDERLKTAEQKITSDAIISTVTESTKYQTDFSSVRSSIDDMEIGGTNIFRPSQVTNLIPASSGVITDYKTGISFHWKVKEGEKYSISRSDNTNDRFRVTYTEEEPRPGIEYIKVDTHDSKLKVEGIEIPPKAKYALLYLQYNESNTPLPDIQVEKGNKATAISPANE